MEKKRKGGRERKREEEGEEGVGSTERKATEMLQQK
jgi:hypothetical protein